MPQYQYFCKCGARKEEWQTIDERHSNAPTHCRKKMEIEMCAPSVMSDLAPYRSMVDGKMITSRSQHREHLRRHSLIEVGNEVSYMLKPRQRKKSSKENRKKVIAEILNNR